MRNARICGRIFYMWGEKMKLKKIQGKGKYKTKKRPFNFYNFGNLFFYNEFSPKFFYFNSLLSSYELNSPNPRYKSKANAIGQKAISELSNIPGIGTEQKDKNKFLSEQIEQILQILDLAIKQERINEQKFVESKIAILKNNFDPLYLNKNEDLATIEKLLKMVGKGDGIDYNAFITLINVLQNGLRNTQSIFQFEKEHLEKLEEARVKSEKALENQIIGLAKSQHRSGIEAAEMVESAKNRRNQRRINAYLNEHNIVNLKGFKKYMKNMEAASNKIASWMMKIIQEQFDKNYSTYVNLIGNINTDKSTLLEQIKSKLVQAILPEIPKFLPEILGTVKENIDANALEQDIIKNFQQNLKIDVHGIPSNLGVDKKKLRLFNERITKNNADTRSAIDIYNVISERIKALRQKPPKSYTPEEQLFMQNLEPFYLSNIAPIEQEMQKVERFSQTNRGEPKFTRIQDPNTGKMTLTITSKQGKDTLKIDLDKAGSIYNKKRSDVPKSLESLLKTMKSAASKKIREYIINLLLNQKNSNVKKDLEDSIRNIAQNIRVVIKGDTVEELMQGLDHTATIKIWTGKTFVKNDFMEIVILPPLENNVTKITNIVEQNLKNINTDNSSQFFQEYKKILDSYQTNIVNAIEADMKEVQSEKAWTDYDKMASQYFASQEKKQEALKNILDKYNELCTIIKSTIKDENERNKQLENLKKITDDFLNSLKNSVYESSTMKTFRTYQNDIGFIGGSLGSTIESQIDSFDQIFTAAGVPFSKELKEWLIFSVLNCSKLSVVKESNKDFVEDYLGGLATFTLFNEGGAELKMLQEHLNDMSINPNNDIMHLYKLNTIYYPGSFVLMQVVKNLKSVVNVIVTFLILPLLH